MSHSKPSLALNHQYLVRWYNDDTVPLPARCIGCHCTCHAQFKLNIKFLLSSNCSLRSSQLRQRTLLSHLSRRPKRLLSPSISYKPSVLLTRRFSSSTLTNKMTDNNPGRLSAADPNSYSNIGVLLCIFSTGCYKRIQK